MRHAFTPVHSNEWFPMEIACRILTVSEERVRQLIQDGQLKARTVGGELRIDSDSVDALSDKLDVLIAKPSPRTYVKIGGRAYEELPDGRLLPV